MARHYRPDDDLEVWMTLTDEGRTILVAILAARGISWRKLARDCGCRSHTFIQRLLRGEESNLSPRLAIRIAKYVDFEHDRLFLLDASPIERQSDSDTGLERAKRRKGKVA